MYIYEYTMLQIHRGTRQSTISRGAFFDTRQSVLSLGFSFHES